MWPFEKVDVLVTLVRTQNYMVYNISDCDTTPDVTLLEDHQDPKI